VRLRLLRSHIRANSSSEQENFSEENTQGNSDSRSVNESPPPESSTSTSAESQHATRTGVGRLAGWWLRQSDVAKAGYITALATAVVAPVLTAALTSGGPDSSYSTVPPLVTSAPSASNVLSSQHASPTPSTTISDSPTQTQPVPRPTKTEDVVVAEGERETALGGQVAIALQSTNIVGNNGWVVYGSVTETATGVTLPLRGAPVGFQANFGKKHQYVVVITCIATGCPDDLTAQFEVSRR
jgi:hypothetical protein